MAPGVPANMVYMYSDGPGWADVIDVYVAGPCENS